MNNRFLRWARFRLAQVLVATALLAISLWSSVDRIDQRLFWPALLGLILPSLLTEPYFTPPRAALATSFGQFAAFGLGDRSTLKPLWYALVVLAGAIVVGAALAMTLPDGHPRRTCHWFATRFGRPILIGSLPVLIGLLQVASTSTAGAGTMVLWLLGVYAVVFLDWNRLVPSLKTGPVEGNVAAALAPNQLLIQSSTRHPIGQSVHLRGPSGGVDGVIAEDFASHDGAHYRVVLAGHWTEVTQTTGVSCTLEPNRPEPPGVLGFAIQGSTESSIWMTPVRRLGIGDTVELATTDGVRLLYQVVRLELRAEAWAQTNAVVPRAQLAQVGALGDSGDISPLPYLPDPFQPLTSVGEVAPLPRGYARLGVLKGTTVPIGIRSDWRGNDGHLAILGMSGMGKTTLAARIARLPGPSDSFIVMDVTAEYRSRLGFGVQTTLDWTSSGCCVFEPRGHTAERCKEAIAAAMAAANDEYRGGGEPKRRFLLLEEAHVWLPEWNFTTQDQTRHVNESCRFILQARKFNLSFVLVSQRTAVVSKSAISQCENYVVFRTLDQTSLEYLHGILGPEVVAVVPSLGRFEAVCVGPIFNTASPIVVSLDEGAALPPDGTPSTPADDAARMVEPAVAVPDPALAEPLPES